MQIKAAIDCKPSAEETLAKLVALDVAVLRATQHPAFVDSFVAKVFGDGLAGDVTDFVAGGSHAIGLKTQDEIVRIKSLYK